MKLMVAGSRSIKEFDLSPFIEDDVDLIITGGADGIDALAEQYADKRRISKLVLRPEYSKYGKAAPLIRNRRMIDIADKILVVWDGSSKGTLHTIKSAKERGKPFICLSASAEIIVFE